MRSGKLRDALKINTLKKRFYLILGVGTILCLFLVIAVSFFSLKAVENTKINTALIADLKEMSNSIDSEYYTLLQVSQQMVSTGSVGRKFNDFLLAETQFDRISLYKEFSESVNIAVFGSRDVALTAYFSPLNAGLGDGKLLFSNFAVDKGFDPEKIGDILDTDEIRFQIIHDSNSGVMNKNVVSVIRPTSFENGTDAMIYVEAYTDVIDSIVHRSSIQKTNYTFLQLDIEGQVCYSSSNEFELGSKIPLSNEELVKTNNYVGVMSVSEFGYRSVLLMPESDYRREINNWFAGILVVIIVAVFVISITATLLIWLIYKPIKTLENEMQHFGDGNFNIKSYSYDVEEFRSLFNTFNEMKVQISTLMSETRNQEKEKSQLELDNLYYQINPHFLLNSLNSVHWLAVANNQTEIDTFISRLNYILGYSLGKIDRSTTLRTEIKSLRMYLDLQKMRYDFNYEISVEEGTYLDLRCARFILQPIAENAVCHNMNEFGNMDISIAHTSDGYVKIVIRDDGKGFNLKGASVLDDVNNQENRGIGIRFIKRTIESFYDGGAFFEIESTIGVGTTVTLRLPDYNGEEN